jgi:hypothetical protein
MIDMKKEKLLSLSEAARFVPCINGKPVHASTIWRWCMKGSRGVHLEHVRLGRRILTSPEAISRFGNRVAKLEDACFESRYQRPKEKTRTRSHHEREKAISDSERELGVAGIHLGEDDERL